MSKFLGFVIVGLVLLIQNYKCEKLIPQVKHLGQKVSYVNLKYMELPEYKITKKNETYNNIGLHWVVKQDLPEDVTIESKIYVTNSKGKNPKLILVDTTPVCKESPNRHLLPEVVVVEKSQLNTQCLKKGVVDTKDMGHFKFEFLIPNLHKLGDHYIEDYKIYSPSKGILLRPTFYSKWGYIN